ncbi:MAG: hypothetical protein K2H85_06195, partial [Allobaculum sp.]|nr:hypothetical protein [Allobaculum sp.]
NNIASKFSNRKVRGLWEVVNSEEVKPSINYSYVSLIFDEAELYFHPKYQTQFIRATLAAIAGLNIADKIKGINIIYSTHSPFILRDMPQCNVLALEDGKPATESIGRTFCANVYDILANGFFMDTFVGMFAADKVKSIIRSLEIRPDVNPKTPEAWQHKVSIMDESNFNPATLQKEIELIGDDFIRNSLLQRWRDIFSEQLSLIEERNRLLERLSEIDSKLNNPQDNDSDKV